MPCHYPRVGYPVRLGGGYTLDPSRGIVDAAIEIPCHVCIGCRADGSSDWGVRCELEARTWWHSRWVTLTYARTPLSERGVPSLWFPHVEKFLGDLRNLQRRDDGFRSLVRTGYTVRYFGSGEYGEDNHRPHYHLCLFNCAFPDEERVGGSTSRPLLYSRVLSEELWPYGYVRLEPFGAGAARYTARYSCKPGHDPARLGDAVPSRLLMSRRPGIGVLWLEGASEVRDPETGVVVREALPSRFAEAYPGGEVVAESSKRPGGRLRRTPKAFDRRVGEADPVLVAGLRKRRLKVARERGLVNPARRYVAREASYQAELERLKKPRALSPAESRRGFFGEPELPVERILARLKGSRRKMSAAELRRRAAFLRDLPGEGVD